MMGVPQHKISLDLHTDVLLVSAIANTDYLLQYLGTQVQTAQTLEFEDHHFYTEEDLRTILQRFNNIKSQQKIILTTEKDATRFELHQAFFQANQLPVYVLPVQVRFCDDDEGLFQEDVKKFLLDFKV